MSKQFEIWWSPVGAANGRKVIAAKDQADAQAQALAEMRRHNEAGAYGAEMIAAKPSARKAKP